MKRAYRYYVLILCIVVLSGSVCVSAKEAVRIAFLTDIHVTPGARSEKALVRIVHEVNAGNFDFLLLTGDLSNNGSDAELQAVSNALKQLKIPYYVISGNHETNWSESAGATFRELFGDDRFLFTCNEYLFVGFATGPYLKMGDGQIKQEDLFWLKQNLAREMKPGKKLIVACHYPLREGLANWFEATKIIKPYSPLFALCGHEHRLSLHNFDGITGLMGRPSFYKNDTIPGYNIIALKEDTVYVYEKRIGESDERFFISFPFGGKEVLKDLPLSPLPDYSINDRYKECFQAKVVIQDSSSVFTGLGLDKQVFVYGNSKGEVVAWDYVKDKLLWKKNYPGSIHASPVVDGNKVFIGDTGGNIHALSLKDGKEQWSTSLEGPIIGEGLVKDGFIYQGAGKKLYKISIKNGQISWSFASDGQLQACPVIHKDCIVFGVWDRHLYCVDTKSGALNWKWNNNHGALLFSPGNVVPAIANGKVFIVAPDRYMTAIDLYTGKTVWRTNKHMVRESMGISADGQAVYAKLMNDSVIAVSTLGNEQKDCWVMDAGFGYDHNPCPMLEHKGIVYLATKNGLLIAIDSRSQRILFQYKCDHSSINKIVPARQGKGVWITSMEGKVIRVEPRCLPK